MGLELPVRASADAVEKAATPGRWGCSGYWKLNLEAMLPAQQHARAKRASALDNILYFAKYRNMNAVFKALSDPTRRQILQLLRKKPMNAGELAAHFPVAKSTLSAHFAILREADLIEAAKSGTVITYMLKASVLEEALLAFAETVGIGLPASAPVKSASPKKAMGRAR